MGLPWWNVVTPHADVLSDAVARISFAADLLDVVQPAPADANGNQSRSEYIDPRTFFRRTFLTDAMRQLLADTLQRLAGTGGVEPVVQLATPFGGGKTHTLLAMYHLAKHGATIGDEENVRTIVQQAGLSAVPTTQVAVLVGTAYTMGGRVLPDLGTIRTLWGEVAYQLGGAALYELLRDDDERMTAPGDAKLREMLRRAGPSLILLDETLPYIESAAAVTIGDTTLANQTIIFIQQLQQAVSASQRTAFFYTLPGSETEQYGAKGKEAYDILKRLQQVAGRLEAVRVPVQGDDIFEVVRRRLFESTGLSLDRDRAVDAYVQMYTAQRGDFPTEVNSPEYRERLRKAYPFHPRLIELFYERWGTLPAFQRTRGVLRTLALAVAYLYAEGKAGRLRPAAMILPADMPLDMADFRASLTRYTGAEYDSVIATDIAGNTAKAVEIDRNLPGEVGKLRPAQGLATAVFLHSFGGGNVLTRGGNEAELRLATTQPDSQPVFGELLSRFKKRLWYLYDDGGLYHFRSVANLNKIVDEAENNVTDDKAAETLRAALETAVKDKAVFRYVHLMPAESRDVADTADLRLVLLSPADVWTTRSDDPAQQKVRDYVAKAGLLPRSNKNSLVFLLADSNALATAMGGARQLVALRDVNTRYGSSDQLTKGQRDDLKGRLAQAESSFPRLAQQAYRHIVIFGEQLALKAYDIGADSLSGESLPAKVTRYLKDKLQLLDLIDLPQYISRFSLWPADKDALNVQTLVGYFNQYTYLPLLTDAPRVLRTAIIQMVGNGQYGLAVGSAEGNFQRVYRDEDPSSAFDGNPTTSLWLITQALALQLKPPAPPPPTGSIGNLPEHPPTDYPDGGTGGGGGVRETPLPPVDRHSYRSARLSFAISQDRFADESDALTQAIQNLLTSASSLRVTVDATGGKLDDLDTAKEILSQYGISVQATQEE